jgi:hypothetical protein
MSGRAIVITQLTIRRELLSMAGQRIRITKKSIYRRRLVEGIKALMQRLSDRIDRLFGKNRRPSDSVIRIKRRKIDSRGSGLSERAVRSEQNFHTLNEPTRGLLLTAPLDGAQVSWRPFVEGTVADPTANVWVIVHPMEVSDFWVQPPTSVREDRHWKVQIYIGRPGTVDVGKYFEIRAVANPCARLYEGKVLTGWPAAECESQLIEVIRE